MLFVANVQNAKLKGKILGKKNNSKNETKKVKNQKRFH